jgi:hypothetical protein
MHLIRIPLTNLSTAISGAELMGLHIDEVYGDADGRFVNIGGRVSGPRGNHERRWTPSERMVLAQLLANETPPALTVESRCRDEVEYFGSRLTTAELEQYSRRTTKRPLLCLALIAASPFIIEALCRLFGVL